MTWQVRALLQESSRNLGPRHLALGAVVCALFLGLGILTIAQASHSLRQQEARVSAGALVWSASGTEEAPIDGRTCEALNGASGIDAAGGVALTRPPSVHRYKGSPPIVVEAVTPGVLRVWDPRTGRTDVTVGRALEATQLLSVGSTLISADGERITVGSRTPQNLAVSRLASGLLVPVEPGVALAECWVRFAPGSVEHAEAAMRHVFTGTHARITPFLTPVTGVATPSEQWHAFADSHPWLVAGALASLVALLTTWTRRSEFAVYRTFGTRRSALSLMLLVELVLVVVPATAAAIVLALLGGRVIAQVPLGADLVATTVRTMLAAALLTIPLGTLAAGLAIRGGLVDQLKDR